MSVKMISAQFVAKVRAGTKRQTIRQERKRPHAPEQHGHQEAA